MLEICKWPNCCEFAEAKSFSDPDELFYCKPHQRAARERKEARAKEEAARAAQLAVEGQRLWEQRQLEDAGKSDEEKRAAAAAGAERKRRADERKAELQAEREAARIATDDEQEPPTLPAAEPEPEIPQEPPAAACAAAETTTPPTPKEKRVRAPQPVEQIDADGKVLRTFPGGFAEAGKALGVTSGALYLAARKRRTMADGIACRYVGESWKPRQARGVNPSAKKAGTPTQATTSSGDVVTMTKVPTGPGTSAAQIAVTGSNGIQRNHLGDVLMALAGLSAARGLKVSNVEILVEDGPNRLTIKMAELSALSAQA